MCAFFFKTSHPVNNDYDSPEHKKLKEMIISPIFKDLPHDLQFGEQYKFNRGNSKHVNIIKECTSLAQHKLLDCQATDKEAAVILAFGIFLQITEFLPFSWVLTPVCYLYAGYLIKERTEIYDQYTKSLENLVRCANWALNNHYTVAADMHLPEVDAMLELLKQVMTKEQLKGIIVDGELEDEFIESINISDEDKQKTLAYRIYGFNQGGSLTQLASKMGGYLHSMFKELVAQCLRYLNTPNDTNTASIRL